MSTKKEPDMKYSGIIEPIKWLLQWASAKMSNIATLVFLVAFFGLLYVAYSFSGVASEAMVRRYLEPKMNPDKMHSVAKRLREMGADSVVIYIASAQEGWRRPVFVLIGDTVHSEFTGRPEALYAELSPMDTPKEFKQKSTYNNSVHIVQMGRVVCDDQTPSSKLDDHLTDIGVTWGCAIGIPPGISKYFIGAILVGYKDKQLNRLREGDIHQQLTLAAYELLQ